MRTTAERQRQTFHIYCGSAPFDGCVDQLKDSIAAAQQIVGQRLIQFATALAHCTKNELTGMRDAADTLEAKQSRRAFDRVHSAKDRVDLLAALRSALRRRLDRQQPLIEGADVLGGLVAKLAVEARQIHRA